MIREDADSRKFAKPSVVRNHQPNTIIPLLAIQVAEIAVPAQRDNIDDQDSVMQGNQLEVDGLDEWPNHPILCQGGPVALLQLFLRACTLHDGHTAQEDEQVGASKYSLITSNSGKDFSILVFEDDFVLQELKPSCCSWTENSCGRLLVSGGNVNLRVRTYLHHTKPSVPNVRDRDFGAPSSQPIAVPWYLPSRTALPL